MTGTRIVQDAKRQLHQLTGLDPDTVSAFERENGGWRVMIEMVEFRRIPAANDVLASYDVRLDENGQLLEYKRVRRYLRSETSEEES